jgi:membrane AbrB-like protein
MPFSLPRPKGGWRDHLARVALTLTLAGVSGYLCSLLHLPIAFMIGSMVATAIAAFAGAPILNPPYFRPPMRAVIGCLLGASITPDVGERALQWWPPLLALIVLLALSGLCGWLVLRKLGRLDPATAYFGAMPGGLFEMVIMGDQKGGDPAAIALLHTIRVFSVILSMPFFIVLMTGLGDMPPVTRPHADFASFLALEPFLWFLGCAVIGAILGRLARLPSPEMFGPLILSAIVHYMGWSTFNLPSELIAAVQVVLGIGVGIRFLGLSMRMFAKLAVLAALLIVVNLAIAAGGAWAMNQLTGMEFLLLFLAFAPAGLNEMTLIAIAVGRDAVFVAVHHLTRIFGVLLVTPPISSLLLRGAPPPDKPG